MLRRPSLEYSKPSGLKRALLNKPLPPIPARMNRDDLLEVLDTLDRVLDHANYVVCGLAAMAVWGYSRRQPTSISVICPSYSKDTIKAWAAAAGLLLYPDRPDSIGVQTADGIVRHVRLRAWESGFHTLRWTQPALAATAAHYSAEEGEEEDEEPPYLYDGALGTTLATRARTATLPTLLNALSRSYARSWAPTPAATQAQRCIATDIFWVLHRIIDGAAAGSPCVPPDEVSFVVSGKFWYPFAATYPQAPDLFARAGLYPHFRRSARAENEAAAAAAGPRSQYGLYPGFQRPDSGFYDGAEMSGALIGSGPSITITTAKTIKRSEYPLSPVLGVADDDAWVTDDGSTRDASNLVELCDVAAEKEEYSFSSSCGSDRPSDRPISVEQSCLESMMVDALKLRRRSI